MLLIESISISSMGCHKSRHVGAGDYTVFTKSSKLETKLSKKSCPCASNKKEKKKLGFVLCIEFELFIVFALS